MPGWASARCCWVSSTSSSSSWPCTTVPQGQVSRVFTGASGVGVEGLGHSTVGGPDLVGQPVELLEVRLAEGHLLLPPVVVDGQDDVEVLGADLHALELELLLGRQDADRGGPALDLA